MADMESFHSHPLGLVGWIARVVQLISAIIVLGITAWATRDTKTVTVIFTLVIVCSSYISLFKFDLCSNPSTVGSNPILCGLFDGNELSNKTT